MIETDLRTKMRVQVRWSLRRDLPEMVKIDRASFWDAWSETRFLDVLRDVKNIGMVAERGDMVSGFMTYRLHRDRIELLRLAVAPEFRRHRVGEQLIRKLAEKLRPERRSSIEINVRESNLDAQLFFKANGFRAIGVNRGHFDDTGEDGYLMHYSLKDRSEVG